MPRASAFAISRIAHDGDAFARIRERPRAGPQHQGGAVVLARATAVRFEAGKARLTSSGKLALEKPLPLLREKSTLRITVTAHPDKGAPEKTQEVAKKRADAIKWYLVEQGVAADQITTSVGEEIVAKGPTIELTLAINPKPQKP